MHQGEWMEVWMQSSAKAFFCSKHLVVAGQSIAVVLPLPDFSMPYNVGCFVLVVVMTYIMGGFALVRKAALAGRPAYASTQEPQ